MKILFVSNSNPDPNQGAPGCDLATIDALRVMGHEIEDVWGSDVQRLIQHPNLHQLMEMPYRVANVIAKKCRLTKYDVIHVNQPHAYIAARQHRNRKRDGIFVNRSHGWEPHVEDVLRQYGDERVGGRPRWRRMASRFIQVLMRRHAELVVRYSDGIVVCSKDDLQYIADRSPEFKGKVVSIAPGVPDDYLSHDAMPMTNERCNRVLYVGSFRKAKAPEIVAKVLNDVLGSVASARATWVCDKGSHNSVLRMVDRNVHGRLRLMGWMSREQLRDVYDKHGIFLFPSYYEGFSLTFLEAMSRGLCVLGSDIDGMRQTIENDQNGFRFERGQARSMVRTATHLINRTDECGRIGGNARKTAMQYTWNRTAKELVEFYLNVNEMKRS
jgi:glycosyltransferase involved in cell wall biosynthesis